MESKTTVKCIYGAGKYGKKLLDYFRSTGREIDFFVQTDQPIERIVSGLTVKSIQEMVDDDKNYIFYIALANKKVVEEIKGSISRLPLKNVKVYECGKFIEENLSDTVKIPEGTKECIICGKTKVHFYPAGIKEELFDKHHIIGGGYRQDVICPCCGAGDRERWLYYVLTNILKITEHAGRILHFAPEKNVSLILSKNTKIDYYTGDIRVGAAMHVTDITDIQYKDGVFDYVISNHVMEHIINEEKAVSEIMRVLKPTGKWILSFPVCMEFKTYEDASIVTDEQRLKAYGQKDHVRLYGNDFKEKFEKYGLKLQIYRPKDELSMELIKKWGLIEDDIIICASK